MTTEQEEQLLEFLRHDVIPLLLEQYPSNGIDALRARFAREYPELDLLSRD